MSKYLSPTGQGSTIIFSILLIHSLYCVFFFFSKYQSFVFKYLYFVFCCTFFWVSRATQNIQSFESSFSPQLQACDRCTQVSIVFSVRDVQVVIKGRSDQVVKVPVHLTLTLAFSNVDFKLEKGKANMHPWNHKNCSLRFILQGLVVNQSSQSRQKGRAQFQAAATYFQNCTALRHLHKHNLHCATSIPQHKWGVWSLEISKNMHAELKW